jgi:hypothetical protein
MRCALHVLGLCLALGLSVAAAGCGSDEAEQEPTSTIGARARELLVAGTSLTPDVIENFVPGGVVPGQTREGCETLAPDSALIADLEAAVTEANEEAVEDVEIVPRGVLAGRCEGTLWVLVAYDAAAVETGNPVLALSEFVRRGLGALEEPGGGPQPGCALPVPLAELWRLDRAYCQAPAMPEGQTPPEEPPAEPEQPPAQPEEPE